MGAGLPARRAGRLVEERPRRGAPLHQQQGELTVTNCGLTHPLITVLINIHFECSATIFFISVYNLMTLENRISVD